MVWNNTVGAVNDPWCDDDYADTDGDGLADWEESLSVYGYFSNSNPQILTLIELMTGLEVWLDGTDPSEPCSNRLDTDSDGLNDYFENSTGCDLHWQCELDQRVFRRMGHLVERFGLRSGEWGPTGVSGWHKSSEASDDQNLTLMVMECRT